MQMRSEIMWQLPTGVQKVIYRSDTVGHHSRIRLETNYSTVNQPLRGSAFSIHLISVSVNAAYKGCCKKKHVMPLPIAC